jgi:hypothetical protein
MLGEWRIKTVRDEDVMGRRAMKRMNNKESSKPLREHVGFRFRGLGV